MKHFKLCLSLKPRTTTHSNTKTIHPLRNKMNGNVLASFITPTITGLPIAIFIALVPSIVLLTPNPRIHNRIISFFLNINLFILFIYFRLRWVFIATHGLSLVAVSGGFCCGVRASRCGGFSCCRAWVLGTRASAVGARRLSSCGSRALEHRLSSCGAWA